MRRKERPTFEERQRQGPRCADERRPNEGCIEDDSTSDLCTADDDDDDSPDDDRFENYTLNDPEDPSYDATHEILCEWNMEFQD